MAFNQFTLKRVQDELGLEIEDGDLFAEVPEYPLRDEFRETLTSGATLALAINTEKAKSEFIIAPLLLEVKRITGDAVSLFSGVELDVDAMRGLNGVCDFVLSRARRQHVLSAPLITIVESKNDNIRDGLGQCIAEMYAAREFNRTSGAAIERVYGIVTIGSAWKFLMLDGPQVTLNLTEYFIDSPDKIAGIILHIIQNG
jgi:hypothetical protein